ncbi:Ankyrin-2 [Madurella mycetomatis]|uniref:Ankyrin-2 n=1 Tax=Madurella mycetomatis TaxID=100816 RepID=A0A175W672_9PEZI|nr:Ankyrin-2 [Madurella mycetomatis]
MTLRQLQRTVDKYSRRAQGYREILALYSQNRTRTTLDDLVPKINYIWQQLKITERQMEEGVEAADDDGGTNEEGDSDEEYPEQPSVMDEMQNLLLIHKLDVEEFEQNRQFQEAAHHLDLWIQQRKEMDEHGDLQFPFYERCEMERKLAQFHANIGTPEHQRKAAAILLGLLREEQSPTTLDSDSAREASLSQELGEVYLLLGRHLEAADYARRVLNYWMDRGETSLSRREIIRACRTRCIAFLKMSEEDNAAAVAKRVSENLGEPEDIIPNLKKEVALDWCEEKHFDTKRPGFRFDEVDPVVPGSLKGYAPLHAAVLENQMHILRYMACHSRALDVTADRDDLPTPLHVACTMRNAKAVEILIDAGATVGFKNKKNRNGLHLSQSSNKGGVDVAMKLLGLDTADHVERRQMLDINERGGEGEAAETAVSMAARMGNLPMLRLLLENEADPNIRKGDLRRGATPLIEVVGGNLDNELAVVNVLLEHGANPALASGRGRNKFTALDKAERLSSKHAGVVDVLRTAVEEWKQRQDKTDSGSGDSREGRKWWDGGAPSFTSGTSTTSCRATVSGPVSMRRMSLRPSLTGLRRQYRRRDTR